VSQAESSDARKTAMQCRLAGQYGRRRGVEVCNTSRCAETNERFAGLIKAIVCAHKIQSRANAPVGGAVKRKSGNRTTQRGMRRSA
jgi:hypothetical protein